MLKHATKSFGVATLLLGAMLAVSCSKSNPVVSQGSSPLPSSGSNSATDVEFASHVATSHPATRTLTFTTSSEIAIAAEGAEIVRRENGMETPIDFAAIQVGDSVEVRGDRQGDNTVLANRIRVRVGNDNDNDEDVEFEGMILSIDLGASTLTVSGRDETILVDDMTRIFAHIDGHSASPSGEGDDDHSGSGDGRMENDTTLSLSDLTVGDSVEVHALFVDSVTLRATAIELEDGIGEDDNNQVEFKDNLGSVDAVTRTVTFVSQAWAGTVADDAELRDLAGNLIDLSGFSGGQLVEVKGFAMDGGNLLIVRMTMDNN